MIFDRNLHCQLKKEMLILPWMSQKGWILKGKMMCSCSESCFKNLVCCVVSQIADFRNQLPCYKGATMSYKNNFGAAVVKSTSIDRFSARAENKGED